MHSDRLTCIDLDLPALEGFRRFISSWCYQGDDYTLLVDPGPLSTIPRLCAELDRLGVRRLDYILLTHIHIDHAGGAGALLEKFPEAVVFCHPEGIRHMVSPEKLWEGSRKVLGQLAEIYGPIVAVPEKQIRFDAEIAGTGIRAFLTPGHAQHHCSYLLDDLLFAGEVAGVHYPLPTGIFMRPATPPRFMLQVALASIHQMLALKPSRMIFAHYGLVEQAQKHLHIAAGQLLLWVRGVVETLHVEEIRREEAFKEWLMEHDPHYRNVTCLPADIQARENYFFGNTLRGMSEFVAAIPSDELQELLSSAPLNEKILVT